VKRAIARNGPVFRTTSPTARLRLCLIDADVAAITRAVVEALR
jgi:hypothetical protein